MKTLHAIVHEGIASFQNDPADSDYQRGYLAALEELARYEPATPQPAPVTGGEDALRLARPIVEADLHAAIEQCDADWEGMSRTALEAIDAALSPENPHAD